MRGSTITQCARRTTKIFISRHRRVPFLREDVHVDLCDSFHQIRVHPDSTKYFSFATPDGQFEFTRLPFGYCESLAEFQKRLVQVLQPFIREDKILVYIDDVLIPSR